MLQSGKYLKTSTKQCSRNVLKQRSCQLIMHYMQVHIAAMQSLNWNDLTLNEIYKCEFMQLFDAAETLT